MSSAVLGWFPLGAAVFGLVLVLVPGSAGAADVSWLRDYAVGDRAEADVTTPVPLIVFDPIRTENLRQAEGQLVPPVFRFVRSGLARGEEALRSTFEARQGEFARDLQRSFRHPVPLLTVEFKSALFAETMDTYRAGHPGFPLTAQLGELWAFGNTGDLVLESWLMRLRRFTNGYSREDALPAGERLAPEAVRLIPADTLDRPLSEATANKSSREIPGASLLTITAVRQEALRGASAEERDLIRFIAGHLQPTCFYDETLTRQARAQRTEAINATDRYQAGQLIVAQGEVITPAVKLALDELRARTVADHAQAVVTAERTARTRVEAEMEAARRSFAATRQINRWLLAGLIAAALLAVLAFWKRGRSRSAPGPGTEGMEGTGAMQLLAYHAGEPALDGIDWRRRALAAEATAQKATALLRSNLLSHMARWMMGEFLQRLLSQRSVILTAQERAEREVAELASRLDQLHAPIEERLKAYEKRILELEAELAAKGEQNVELIKAKIESTRKHLEDERSQEPVNWN